MISLKLKNLKDQPSNFVKPKRGKKVFDL